MSELYPIQQSFLGGVLSPRLSGLTDNPLYQAGLKDCINWQITPQGSLRLRQGSRYMVNAVNAQSRIFNYTRANRDDVIVEVSSSAINVYDTEGEILKQGYVNGNVINDPLFYKEFSLWKYTNNAYEKVRGNKWAGRKINFSDDPAYAMPNLETGIGATVRLYWQNEQFQGEEFKSEERLYQDLTLPEKNITYRVNTAATFLDGYRLNPFKLTVKLLVVNPDNEAQVYFERSVEWDRDSPADAIANFNGTFNATAQRVRLIFDVKISDVDSRYFSDYFGDQSVPSWNVIFQDITMVSTAATPSDAIFTSPYNDVDLSLIQVAYDTGKNVMVLTHPEVQVHQMLESRAGIFAFGSLPYEKEPSGFVNDNYPAVCEFFQGRLWLASTSEEPSKIWASQSGNYLNFELDTVPPESPAPIGKSEFALEFDLETNGIIRWLRGNKVLVIGTDSSLWTASSTEATINATNFRFLEQSRLGSVGNIAPQYVADQIAFVGLDSRRVRAVNYDSDLTATWVSNELTLQAEHLMFERIIDVAYARDPDYQLAVVTGDGKMHVCMTDRILDLNAWYTYETDGYYRSVEYSNDATGSSLWVVVERPNGSYVEKFNAGTEIKSHLDSYLNRAIEYDGDDNGVGGFSSAFNSGFDGQGLDVHRVKNLEHFEGETVSAVTKQTDQPTRKVFYGLAGDIYVYQGQAKIDFETGMNTAFIGRPFTATAETWPSNVGNRLGTSQGSKRHFNRIFARCVNDSAYPILNGYRPVPDKPLDNPLETMITDDIEIRNEGTNEKGVIVIEQNLPLGTEISCLFGKLTSGVT